MWAIALARSPDKELLIAQFDTIQVQLPDEIRDTETILIDPILHDMYLISKRENSVKLYRVRYPFTRKVMTAEYLTEIPFHNIVAASISLNGNEILMKDYDDVYYWENKKGLPLAQLFIAKPQVLAYDREPQGESICWDRDGSGYYTLSEKVKDEKGKLLFYKRN